MIDRKDEFLGKPMSLCERADEFMGKFRRLFIFMQRNQGSKDDRPFSILGQRGDSSQKDRIPIFTMKKLQPCKKLAALKLIAFKL